MISETDSLSTKISHAKELIAEQSKKYKNIAVGCSFGKDSMVTVDIARKVDPDIPIFSIMTQYKPAETFQYLVQMDKEMNLNTTVYMVADYVPSILEENQIRTKLLPTSEFKSAMQQNSEDIYRTDPDLCCKLLKVNPTKVAVHDLDAWITGLRNTEGRIRENYQELEFRGNIAKINPILKFTEEDILTYLAQNQIDLHPWYTKVFEDGRKYRSLGCAPCTNPIALDVPERYGRWQATSKCGGECGIHTQILKK